MASISPEKRWGIFLKAISSEPELIARQAAAQSVPSTHTNMIIGLFLNKGNYYMHQNLPRELPLPIAISTAETSIKAPPTTMFQASADPIIISLFSRTGG